METGLTLFGGLAAVMLLYAGARALRMPAELAGLVAAGIPLFAYIATLFGAWPGLDVVAIHVAVFIIAAFVLAVFSRLRARQARMHWAPKALIAFFLVLIVMNAGFLYVSTKGLPPALAGLLLPGGGNRALHTGFAGTTRHGEEAARAVGADLSRRHRNEALGWQVRVEGLRMPSVGQNAVTVFADDGNGRPLANLAGEWRIGRPGAEQIAVPLKATVAGQYEARLDFSAAGLWLVELQLDAYRQTWEIRVP
ncbi:MAG: FixH family protein [Pseudomonadota bacterium]